ncbi:hypothetical protein SAMN05216297_11736 [Flavobacterium phragmitis]|uniref:Uncharacterized protein n=1 Tax=Flavobacterium phragmitis TaxID=739143 RepID=A0A1I1WTS1_9FLAO|nr:hypothetical protein SAMN05216297_11736 [Flavobacterium phragmitis]
MWSNLHAYNVKSFRGRYYKSLMFQFNLKKVNQDSYSPVSICGASTGLDCEEPIWRK